jgi:hypothetical protein
MPFFPPALLPTFIAQTWFRPANTISAQEKIVLERQLTSSEDEVPLNLDIRRHACGTQPL